MSVIHFLDNVVRHGGLGRVALALLPAFLALDLRRMAWFARAKKGEALVDVEQVRPQFAKAIEVLQRMNALDGDYLEFGVFNGTSMITMNHALLAAGADHVRLFGFDSFEGLPPEAATSENQGWRPGCYASEIQTTRARLSDNGVSEERSTLVKGWFKDTLTPETVAKLGLRKASIVMIDVDIYTATVEALDFVAPLIGEVAIIVFDDWHFSDADRGEGQKKALDEFMARRPEFRADHFGSYEAYGDPTGEIYLLRRI